MLMRRSCLVSLAWSWAPGTDIACDCITSEIRLALFTRRLAINDNLCLRPSLGQVWLTSSKATLHLLLEIKLDSNWKWRGEFNAQVLTCAFGFWLHQFACICIFSRAVPNVCQASRPRLRPRLQPRPDQHWTLGRGPAWLASCVCAVITAVHSNLKCNCNLRLHQCKYGDLSLLIKGTPKPQTKPNWVEPNGV